jgi:hypothetical protein
VRTRLYFDEDSARHSLARELRFRGAGLALSVGEQMRRLLRLISSLTAEEMRNRIEFLSAWS